MSELIGIVGSSGTGKSTSYLGSEDTGIKGLNPNETFVINISGKSLPVRGWKKLYTPFKGKDGGNYLVSNNPLQIMKAMRVISSDRPEIKNIVIDDGQYIMGFEFMAKALEKGFEKFNVLGKNYFEVLNLARQLRDDLHVYVLTHSEEIQRDFETVRKMKTLGKMIDDKITLEGLFTVILYTDVEWDDKEMSGTYSFITNKTNDYPAKSPVGMFDKITIPNDLGVVCDIITDYYNGE